MSAATALSQEPDQQSLLEAWLETGRQIAKGGSDYHWRVGDWLCNANGLDEKTAYREAEVITGIRRKMLYDLSWVAAHVSVRYRNPKLSWNHHRQVAHVEPQQQKEWLEQAAAEGWTVSSLRDIAKEPRKRGERKEKPKKMFVKLTGAQQDLVQWYAKARGVSPTAFLQQVIDGWYRQAALESQGKQQPEATVTLQ